MLPARITFEQAWQLRAVGSPLFGLVGVGGDELTGHGPDLGRGMAAFVVAGPMQSGRSTVLVSMARSLLASAPGWCSSRHARRRCGPWRPSPAWSRPLMSFGADRQRALVLAGDASEVCSGFGTWQTDAKKARRGCLLAPQDFTDGDLIGTRIPRDLIGKAVQPGRALLHLGDGRLLTVQVPFG